MDPGCDVVAARARDILPGDVGDGDMAAVAILRRVDARDDVDGLINLAHVDVLEGHILDVPAAGICLDPRGVAARGAAQCSSNHTLSTVSYTPLPMLPMHMPPDSVQVMFLTKMLVLFPLTEMQSFHPGRSARCCIIRRERGTHITAPHGPVRDIYVPRVPRIRAVRIDGLPC